MQSPSKETGRGRSLLVLLHRPYPAEVPLQLLVQALQIYLIRPHIPVSASPAVALLLYLFIFFTVWCQKVKKARCFWGGTLVEGAELWKPTLILRCQRRQILVGANAARL
ncbi:hypothetical protein ACFX1T_013112 [Malus domestica]